MTLFLLISINNVAPYSFRLLFFSLLVLCISFLIGASFGWTGPAFNSLTSSSSSLTVSVDQLTTVSAFASIGSFTVTMCFLIFVENHSRRWLIVIISILALITWSLCFWPINVYFLYASGFCDGLVRGLFDINACIYLGEILSPQNRSIVGAIMIIVYNFGSELTIILGFFNYFPALSAAPLLVSVCAILGSFFAVESPYYLVANGRHDEALRVVRHLHGNDDEEARKCLDEISDYLKEENSTEFWTYIRTGKNFKICVTMVILNTIAFFNCFNIVVSYGIIVMRPFAIEPNLLMNTIGGSTFVFVLISLVTSKMAGRKTLMICGFVALSMIQFLLGLEFSFVPQLMDNHAELPYIVVTLILLFLFVFFLTVYPTIYALRSEMFPQRIKERGTCILAAFKSMVDYAIITTFFPVASAVGISINFYVFSFAAAIGAVCVVAFLRESKGKTLAQIQQDYK